MKQAFEVKDKAILDAAELILEEIKAIGADEGETWVSRVYHLDRGFERLEEKLTNCGAIVERVRD